MAGRPVAAVTSLCAARFADLGEAPPPLFGGIAPAVPCGVASPNFGAAAVVTVVELLSGFWPAAPAAGVDGAFDWVCCAAAGADGGVALLERTTLHTEAFQALPYASLEVFIDVPIAVPRGTNYSGPISIIAFVPLIVDEKFHTTLTQQLNSLFLLRFP